MSLKSACCIILIFSGFWSISCTPKSAEKLQPTTSTPTEGVVLTEDVPSPDTIVMAVDTVIEKQEPARVELVASIKKTACYGKCPVFEAKVYSDGRVLYEGKQYTDKSGIYVAYVNEEWIADIRTYAISLGFFKMSDQFPEKNAIPDLPNTITFLQHKGMEKTVNNNHNAPIQLTKIEDFFLQKLNSLDWKVLVGEN